MSKWFVPYNYKGDMQECSSVDYPNVETVNRPPYPYRDDYKTAYWKPNDPFVATLTYLKYSVGRSSVTLYFTDDQMREYPMRLKDFVDIILLMDKGSITGTWKANKRGAYYALVMVN